MIPVRIEPAPAIGVGVGADAGTPRGGVNTAGKQSGSSGHARRRKAIAGSLAGSAPATATQAGNTDGHRRGRTIGWQVLPWLLPLGLVALWSIGAAGHWIPSQVLPPPAHVVEVLGDLITSGELWDHVQASLRRVLVGFAVGSLVGTALGAAMGLSRRIESYLLPTFNALVQIPVLGWLPFVLLLVGIGEPLKYVLIAKAAVVPTTLNTLQGIRRVPDSLLEVARVHGYSRRQEVIEVVLPQAAPVMFTGVRLAFTKAWLSLVVVELVASSEGLGFLIVYGRQLFQLDQVMAAVLVVGAIGFAIDRMLDHIERRARRGAPA